MLDLKYLFEAVFADGETILQPEDNVSKLKPDFDENDYRPSAFYDVLEKSKECLLEKFSLIGDGHRYTVDLKDGHFEIDGIPFQAHPQELRVWSTPDKPLRVIYFRETKRNTDIEYEADADGQFQLKGSTDHAPVVGRYVIGWQTNLENGENIQQTIIVE